ncbi:hypothetical protein BGZ94_005492, partial [Podila epigama]
MDGYVVEEGAIPSQAALLLRTIYQVMSEKSSKSIKTAQSISLQEKVGRNAREVATYVAGVYRGAMANTQTFLVMSHDDARGELHLKDDRIRIHWPGVGTSRNFSRLDTLLEPLAEAVRATYVRNPLTSATDDAIVTVHPIGGCGMANTGAEGVTNHKGQVFTGQGEEVYEGLYVMDGAIMPMSLGVNPFLTISALAERACALLARDRGWTIKYDPTLTPIDFKTPQFPIPYEPSPEAVALAESLKKLSLQEVAAEDGEIRGLLVSEPFAGDSSSSSESDSDDDHAKRTLPNIFSTWGRGSGKKLSKREKRKKAGVSFTELLKGHLSTVILTEDFDTANNQARSAGSTMNVVLTLSTGPIDEFIKRTDHTARIVGTVSCRAMSDQPMMIESGIFTIFTGTEDDPADESAILYKMGLLCASGERYRFEGRKPISTGHVIEGWIKPSRVLVTVYKVEDGVETLFGRGKLGDDDDAFFTQVTSLRGDGTSLAANLKAIKEFGTSTISATVRSYLPFLNELQYPEDTHTRKTYKRQRPTPKVYNVVSSDGFNTRLTRYPGKKGPVLL